MDTAINIKVVLNGTDDAFEEAKRIYAETGTMPIIGYDKAFNDNGDCVLTMTATKAGE